MPKRTNLKNGQLTAEKTQALYNFFQHQSQLGIKYWSRDKTYIFNGTTYRFTNDIYQREGKNGLHRYEVVSNKELGNGSFGTVKLIKNTVTFANENAYFKKVSKKDGSRRVVKIQNYNLADSDKFLEKEYQASRKASHLAIKQPVIIADEQISLIRMKRLPGRELFSILHDANRKKRILTIPELVELSSALLKALKEQVIDKGIIHRDIKPGNILVDLGPPIVVNIIDYGLSINESDKPIEWAGMPAYVAPETLITPELTSFKSDIYSMGRVLAFVWGGYNETYTRMFSYLEQGEPGMLRTLFTNLDKLGKEDKAFVYAAIYDMVQMNPDNRSDIDRAIMAFRRVEEQFNPEFHAKLFHNYHSNLLKKISFFKQTQIKGSEGLAEILAHAKEKNNRSREVCVKLNWLNQDGTLADNAPYQISEAYPKHSKTYSLRN
ncbi:serine/threonine-protein kinase [Legionella beliardensis]|uniref:Serine/threonine-protein kinase n=1 Tax=Legionella beliardensis TaxID=91822 RepID=A0A378HYL4_9GAMM|nr:protein kinase [Legionella beliardensis]STX27989.1 serine/threonine-protein kinase [Legionella beliardensis]